MLQTRPVGDELGPFWTRLCFERLLFFHAFAVVASGWNAPAPLGPGPTQVSPFLSSFGSQRAESISLLDYSVYVVEGIVVWSVGFGFSRLGFSV